MSYAIDTVIVKTVLGFTTWVKRHPVLFVLALLILLALPLLPVAMVGLFARIVGVVGRIAGENVANYLGKFFSTFFDYMHKLGKTGCVLFSLLAGLASPVVGGLLLVWCAVDSFKPENSTVVDVVPPDPVTPVDEPIFIPPRTD
jgi:energy-converting hydrogenase Eha subunit A